MKYEVKLQNRWWRVKGVEGADGSLVWFDGFYFKGTAPPGTWRKVAGKRKGMEVTK